MTVPVPVKKYAPAPVGFFNAVCVDVVMLGIVQTQYGERDTVKIVWELEELMDDGRPFTVKKFYTRVFSERSTLMKDFIGWFGSPPKSTTGEVDIDKLVGCCCRLLIKHQTNDKGQTFDRVDSVMKFLGERRLEPSGHYVREIDRDKQEDKTGNGATSKEDAPEPEAASAGNGGFHNDAREDEEHAEDVPF